MTAAPAVTPLCVADDATFWPWHRWPEFARWENPAATVVVVPLAGTADWGLGHALDAEETVLMHVLRAASRARPTTLPLLVVPPLRFVLGPGAGCAFAVEPPVAHAFVSDVLGSIAAAGFRKIVLYNSSPWNEDFIAAAARDNRVALGLQLFRISLSGLGLDLHPTRSTAATRRTFQTLVTALTGREPEPPPADAARPSAAREWGDERIFPLPGPAVPFNLAQTESEATVAVAAQHLASLLSEIHACAPLAHDGNIHPAQP